MATLSEHSGKRFNGRLLLRASEAVGGTLFLLAFGGFIIQVFFRYVMNDPLRWSEEFVMICFIWTVFWAAAFMVPIREHVSFDVVYEVVGPRTRRVFSIIAMLAVIIAFLMLIPPTLDYLDFLQRKKSPVLRIQMHWIYGCYILFVVGFMLQSCARLVRLLGANWRDQI